LFQNNYCNDNASYIAPFSRLIATGDFFPYQSQSQSIMSSMEDYDERVAQSLGAASFDEDNADNEDADKHTQFLDLTNGEGGSRISMFYESDEEEEEEDGATTVTTIDPTSTPGKVVETGQEHTGRWTREEHSAFLSALKTHGKEWKKVAAKVKTRTVVQTRTHAQKYFQKLHKAVGGTGNDPGRVTSVEMCVDAKHASAQKKKKTAAPKPPQRMQSTASTHAAAHVMTNLSSAQMSPAAPFVSSAAAVAAAYAQPTAYSASASTSAPLLFATHGFSTATTSDQNDQPLLPPQAIPSYPPSGGFFGGFGLSIVAPPQDSARSKFPEPSPAACGKRKLAEIAVAQMLAGVASSQVAREAATPPPPELPAVEPWYPSLGLQIVNPESLGVTYNEMKARRGDPSPTTPWDGQLQALVRYIQKIEETPCPCVLVGTHIN
jgi:SHAQKYF class myb-like DNA-binding protein